MNSDLPHNSGIEQRMDCMAVCGGHDNGIRHYRRPGLDVWVLSLAHQDVAAGGGDLHLISSCASGRITRMLLADICGFGALFNGIAARLREVMKRNVNTIKQTRSVHEMSEHLKGSAQHGCFASTLISTYFAPTRSFTVCNAGHPAPMLCRRATREWSLLKQPGEQKVDGDGNLGVLSATEYQQMNTTLEVGDMVLTYGNSLTEARARNGQTMGVDALLRRVQELDCNSPADIPQRLVDNIVSERADNLGDSDATIVLCQATEARVDWRDNVLAPFRLLRSVTDRTSFS